MKRPAGAEHLVRDVYPVNGAKIPQLNFKTKQPKLRFVAAAFYGNLFTN